MNGGAGRRTFSLKRCFLDGDRHNEQTVAPRNPHVCERKDPCAAPSVGRSPSGAKGERTREGVRGRDGLRAEVDGGERLKSSRRGRVRSVIRSLSSVSLGLLRQLCDTFSLLASTVR